MSTQFRGHKTGFNRGGNNDCVPDADGQTTNFRGRGALPNGKLQRTPGIADATAGGNRRLAKSKVGDGGGSGTKFKGVNAFSKK